MIYRIYKAGKNHTRTCIGETHDLKLANEYSRHVMSDSGNYCEVDTVMEHDDMVNILSQTDTGTDYKSKSETPDIKEDYNVINNLITEEEYETAYIALGKLYKTISPNMGTTESHAYSMIPYIRQMLLREIQKLKK